MDNNLSNKILNLIDISPKEPSIKTIIDENYFSLLSYFEKDDLDLLWNGKKEEISFFNYTNKNFLNLLSKAKNSNDIKEICLDGNIPINPDLKKQLKTIDFLRHKSKITAAIIGEAKNILEKFEIIKFKANEVMRNNGFNPLHISSKFLSASLKGGHVICSPVFFCLLEITIDSNWIKIIRTHENNIINQKLFYFLERNKITIDSSLKNHEIMKNLDSYFNYEVFDKKIDFKRDSSFNYLINDYILGFYNPNVGFLYNETVKIINLKKDVFDHKIKYSNAEIVEMEINNKIPVLQITDSPLNLYQRQAVVSSLVQNTLLHGPPGTGKSETIVNFLSTIMFNGESAIVTSEKIAAIDVIQERFGQLENFCFLADASISKDVFYSRIRNLDKLISYSEKSKWKNKKTASFESLKSENKIFLSSINEILKFEKFKNRDGLDLNFYIKNRSKISHVFLLYKTLISNLKINEINNLMTYLVNFQRISSQVGEFEKYIKRLNEIRKDYLDSEFNKLDDYYVNLSFSNAKKINTTFPKDIINEILKDWINFSDKWININNIYIPKLININPDWKDIINNKNQINSFNEKYRTSKNKKLYLQKWLEVNGLNNQKSIGGVFLKMTDYGNAALSTLEEIYNSSRWWWDLKVRKMILNKLEMISKWSLFIVKNNEVRLGKPGYLDSILVDWESLVSSQKSRQEISKENINIETMKEVILLLEYEKNYLIKSNSYVKDINFFDKLFEKYKSLIYSDNKLNLSRILERVIDNTKIRIIKSSREIQNEIKQIFEKSKLVKLMDVEKFINLHYNALLVLFNVWLGRPEEIIKVVVRQKKNFEYGIFDEASQMFLERSIVIMSKCNKHLIAGDEKQLQPSSFFSQRDDDILEEDIDVNTAESLLERVKAGGYSEFYLKNHYRSQSYQLIEFSNKFIYDGNLEFGTVNGSDSNSLQVINVRGSYVNNINVEEANKVLEVLKREIKKYKKIIVITFGAKQSSYIQKIAISSSNSLIKKSLLDGKLVITNLENVQGNEGDLVIISNSYGPKNKGGSINNSFGPLVKSGGKNRINVAITRAKEKMIVIKSFKRKDMSPNINNPDAMIYANFISHLDSLKDAKIYIIKSPLVGVAKIVKSKIGLKYKVQENYKIGSDVLNLVILDKKNSVVLGVLIESIDTTDRMSKIINLEKRLFIESRKYETIKISYFDWNINPEDVSEKIIKKVFTR